MKFHKIISFLLIIICSNCSCTLLSEKATFFANLVFKEFLTSVVWWQHSEYRNVTDDVTDYVTDFTKHFQGCSTVVTLRDNESSNEVVKKFNMNKSFTQTVYFGAYIYEVEYFISLVCKDLVTPIRLIVVFTQSVTNTELTELMKIAFYNDVTNILIISPNDNDLMVTTYFPYRNGKCDDFTPIHLNHNTKEIFPRKFLNFHGCEVRTTMLHLPPYSRLKFENDTLVSVSGIDGNVLKILFNVLNASMKVISAKDHVGLGAMANGTPTGSFADLVNKKSDILLPSLYMTKFRYPYVQITHTHKSAIMTWFGPPRRATSDWMRIFQPFISQITPALFGTSVVFIVVTMIVRRYETHKPSSRKSFVFQTFVIFLGIEVKFETKSLLMNCLFVSWIWFCMVVRIAYQGNLVNGLQNIIFESPLGTFESEVERVEAYGGLETLRFLIKGTRYYNDYQAIGIKNITNYLKTIETGKNNLILTETQVALDSAPNLQILEGNAVSEGSKSFCMRPGWPAAPDIDYVLLQIIDKGLVQKVFNDNYWEHAKAAETKTSGVAKPLSLQTLSGCYYGLVVMYVICTIILVAEIVHYRVKGRKKKALYRRK